MPKKIQDGAVLPKTEGQWKREGFTEEEIRAYSVIGLVLVDPENLPEYDAFVAGWAARNAHLDGYTDENIEMGHIRRDFTQWLKERG